MPQDFRLLGEAPLAGRTGRAHGSDPCITSKDVFTTTFPTLKQCGYPHKQTSTSLSIILTASLMIPLKIFISLCTNPSIFYTAEGYSTYVFLPVNQG